MDIAGIATATTAPVHSTICATETLRLRRRRAGQEKEEHQKEIKTGRIKANDLTNFKIFSTVPNVSTPLSLILICATYSSVTIVSSYSLSPSQRNQNLIIFDPIGEMAASVTYFHVAIPVNLSSLTDQAKVIALIMTNMTEQFQLKIQTHKTDKMASLGRVLNDISILLLNKLEHHLQKLHTIKLLLPAAPEKKSRQKRFVFLAPFIIFHKKFQAEYDAHIKTQQQLNESLIENSRLR